MERLTTDTPKGNFQTLMNFAYAENGEVMLRWAGGKDNANLREYLASEAYKYGCDQSPKDIGEGMCYGCEDPNCHIQIMLVLATQAAELRGRLKMYEDKEEDTHRRNSASGRTCADCKNFVKDLDAATGICKKRQFCRNRWGLENPNRPFRPSQSRMACKEFFEKKAE